MEKLLKAMELFRSYDPEIPAQVISVFLYIASHDDVSKVQIQDKEVGLNMPSASASRNTDWFHCLLHSDTGILAKNYQGG